MAQPSAFEVRLAVTPDEIKAAQALRYRVFYEEMNAVATPAMRAMRRDFDPFDPFCDHLIVLDRARDDAQPCVVGTYRLLRRSVAYRTGGFYSAQEFDLSALTYFPGEILELGRSCVDSAYRARGIMPLLWRGISAYLARHRIGLMFGCASFAGTEPEAHRLGLSYLYHHHLAPMSLRPRALDDRYVPMERLPRASVDRDLALDSLPPLMKGYVRLGGFVGDGAVVDSQFGTLDVCIVVETSRLAEKYRRHYRPFGTSLADPPRSPSRPFAPEPESLS